MSTPARITRDCPCCGARTASAMLDNRLAAIGGLDMSYTVSRCEHCGFLYASELPSVDSYAHYYRTLSKYDQVVSISQISTLDRIRARASVALCAPHLARDATIADVGCGVGNLLHAFHEAGWHDLLGIDPAPWAPARARDLFGLAGVRNGMLSEAATLLPLDRTGLVCLTGVLEHLWSPHEELSTLFGRLKPGTLVLIEVPALEHFAQQPCEPFGEFSLEHIQYFSEGSLRRTMARLGADSVSTEILDLGGAGTDSLLCLFRINANGVPSDTISDGPAQPGNDAAVLSAYIEQSASDLDKTITRITAAPRPWIIHGAGSHTARLLPVLADRGLDGAILGVTDGNANLHGQQIGRWTINPPAFLEQHREATVIISSFRSQRAIHAAFATRYPNPLLCLYSVVSLS